MSVSETLSILASAALLYWVKLATGRGAIDIILEGLPPLF